MLNFSHQTRVFLFMEPVDMRKSFRGLCLLAESVLKEDPASGHWFAFINRRRDRLKLLGWDGQGFWIWYKRLESGVIPLDNNASEQAVKNPVMGKRIGYSSAALPAARRPPFSTR